MTIPFDDLRYKPLANIPDQKLSQFIRKTYPKPSVATESDFKAYNDKIADIRSRFETQFSYILSCCDDIDPVINIWSPKSQSKTTVIDTVDFREYMKTEDLTGNAFRILQDDPDIATMWSPSEDFDIIISDAVFYRVHRVLYDYVNIGIRYVICEYNRIRMSETEILTVPVNMIVLHYGPSRIRPGHNETICDLKPEKHIHINDKALAQLARFPDKSDTSDYHVVELCNLGQMGFLNITSHMMLHHSHLPKPTFRLFRDMISCICYDIHEVLPTSQSNVVSSAATDHIETTSAIVASAILVMNSYLKNKKLSKPVPSTVERSIDIILQNRPERKTRLLGDNIKVMSETRLTAPDHEKLIKYHTPEWTRRAHLRHLKDGRVIEIPAGKCYRTCVNMTNVRSLLPQQGTDYIIKPKEGDAKE